MQKPKRKAELRMAGWTMGSLILLAVLCLTFLGLSILFSATAHASSDPYHFLRRQAIWLGIALVCCVIAATVNLEFLRRFIWVAPVVFLAGLILVLIPGIGVEVNGSRRWIEFGPMRMQVSEFAKLGMVFFLACYLGACQREIKTFWKGFAVPSAVIGVFALLILLQPDYGTAALCAVVGFILLYLAGTRMLYLVPSVLGAAAVFAVAVVHDPVRWKRIVSYLDMESHRGEGAYQLWQAVLAFGAGGTNGVGLGNGRQQMAFLPEAHTDFIFAVIGEELGFYFTGAVLALFVAIFIGGLVLLRRAPNMYQFLFVAGGLFLLVLQAIINMGVVTGCFPTKGMSLPFISYGGSNLVVMFVIAGILLNAGLRWSRPPLRGARREFKEIVA